MATPLDDLWADTRAARQKAAEPLATRLRPASLEEFVGQEHFLGPGKLLRRMLDGDALTSLLFAGPPGTGKTTLAELVATRTQAHFERANAASIGVKEIREIVDGARRRLGESGRRTILFLDEIHRFSKAQQDVLLGDVERGTVILIGATTENPYYAVNAALVSRSTVFTFQPLSEANIATILARALVDPRGLGPIGARIVLTDDAVAHWARICDGDARRALGALEVAALSLAAGAGGGRSGGAAEARLVVDRAVAEESIQAKAIVYDGSGDQHYDLASAFIKSMRGSDPDAATYWLARMLVAGEDPRFIARRIAIFASEDIGNADPQAAILAAATWQNVERIGMPEGQLLLGQAAIYMACAPKSGASSIAIWTAMDEAKDGRTIPVPMHLLDQTKRTMTRHDAAGDVLDDDAKRALFGYRNPHEERDGLGRQEYLGVERTYYQPTTRGFEATLKDRLDKARAIRRKGSIRANDPSERPTPDRAPTAAEQPVPRHTALRDESQAPREASREASHKAPHTAPHKSPHTAPYTAPHKSPHTAERNVDHGTDRNVDRTAERTVASNVDRNVDRTAERNVASNVDRDVDRTLDHGTAQQTPLEVRNDHSTGGRR